MDEITYKIAEYAATASFDQLTDATVHAATQRLIDLSAVRLGLMIASRRRSARSLAAGQIAGKYPGCVLCFGDRLPAEAATFINSAMIRNFDFNDRYPGGHPSDCLGALFGSCGRHECRWETFPCQHERRVRDFCALERLRRMLSRSGWDQGYAIGIATAAGVCNLLAAFHRRDRPCRRNRRYLQSTAPCHPIRRAHALEKCRDGLCRARMDCSLPCSPRKA